MQHLVRTPRDPRQPAFYSLVCALFAACVDPFHFDATAVASQQQAEEICAASMEWLPHTPAVELFEPAPHPETECPFYRGAWQNFLIATEPAMLGA
jgi:hypothetical protein